ncbi:MAG: zinc ribbon domain-containing protein [Candidatus Marinimicrobia bacterium]|nr:zinc ribbon domain-containing protein [Candidatus Neomarinimicrobiota bacterium]
MPTYEYLCNTCGERFDAFQSMSDDALQTKPNCDVSECNITRIVSGGAGLIFKGTGFYLTDYKNNGKPKKPQTDTKPKTETKSKKKDR